MSQLKTIVLIALSIGIHCAYAETLIAVPDLSYKKEVKEFFYYEAANSKSSASSASSYEAAGYDRSTKSSALMQGDKIVWRQEEDPWRQVAQGLFKEALRAAQKMTWHLLRRAVQPLQVVKKAIM